MKDDKRGGAEREHGGEQDDEHAPLEAEHGTFLHLGAAVTGIECEVRSGGDGRGGIDALAAVGFRIPALEFITAAARAGKLADPLAGASLHAEF